MKRLLMLLNFALVFSSLALAENFSGKYVLESGEGDTVLNVRQNARGEVQGTLELDDGTLYQLGGEIEPIGHHADGTQHLVRGGAAEMAPYPGHYEPLRVVRWLRDHLRASGIRLEPGHLLSLGNLDITRQLKPDSPQGSPAYRSNRFTLSYYGLSDAPATVTVNIDR